MDLFPFLSFLPPSTALSSPVFPPSLLSPPLLHLPLPSLFPNPSPLLSPLFSPLLLPPNPPLFNSIPCDDCKVVQEVCEQLPAAGDEDQPLREAFADVLVG